MLLMLVVLQLLQGLCYDCEDFVHDNDEHRVQSASVFFVMLSDAFGVEEDEQTDSDEDYLDEDVEDQPVVSCFLVVFSVHLVVLMVKFFVTLELRSDFLLRHDVIQSSELKPQLIKLSFPPLDKQGNPDRVNNGVEERPKCADRVGLSLHKPLVERDRHSHHRRVNQPTGVKLSECALKRYFLSVVILDRDELDKLSGRKLKEHLPQSVVDGGLLALLQNIICLIHIVQQEGRDNHASLFQVFDIDLLLEGLRNNLLCVF